MSNLLFCDGGKRFLKVMHRSRVSFIGSGCCSVGKGPANIPANVIVNVLADASVVQSHDADFVVNGLSDVRVPKHLIRLSGRVSA